MSGPLNSPKPTTSVVVGGVYNVTTPAPADKQALALQTDNEGNLLVNVAVSGASTVTINPATPAGFHIANNTVQAIKASAGVLHGYFLDNTANSATSYFQFFNVASGSVSLGSTASLFVIPVPAGLAANLAMSGGWTFSTAMSFAATTTYSGSTAPSSAVDCTIAIV